MEMMDPKQQSPSSGSAVVKETATASAAESVAGSRSRRGSSGGSRQMPSFIILHYSPFKAVWDWVVLLLVLYTAVFTPYTTAFLLNEDKTKAMLNRDPKTRVSLASDNKAGPLVVIDLIVDVIFIADIFINFRTTYVHSGEVIADPQKIARNYIRGWFLLDACAAIPFDLVVFGTGGSTDAKPNNVQIMTSTGVLKTARLLRLLRVARRIHQYSEYGAVMMLFLMVTFTLVAHWLACIFYVIAHYERETFKIRYGWLDMLAKEYKEPYIDNRSDSLSLGGPSIESRYITSLYFVFTAITSIGFGNVSPNTNLEKIFSIFAMVMGSMMSAAIFGNVSSIMLRLYQGSEECHEGRTRIKEFIRFHRIPKGLAKRLHDSFETNWDYTNGVNMNAILKAFPECLQADICLHMNRTLLNTCAAFKGASAGCLRAFALQFRTTHIPPGDTFLHPGDLLESVFFISRGSVEIIYETGDDDQDRTIMGVLNVHEIFGGCPIDFLREKVHQSLYGVKANGFVDLHRISLLDLKGILLMYPEWSETFVTSFKLTFKLNEFMRERADEEMDCGSHIKLWNMFKLNSRVWQKLQQQQKQQKQMQQQLQVEMVPPKPPNLVTTSAPPDNAESSETAPFSAPPHHTAGNSTSCCLLSPPSFQSHSSAPAAPRAAGSSQDQRSHSYSGVDVSLVAQRMAKLNSRAQAMERNYQTAFTEILQLLSSTTTMTMS